MDTEEKNTEEKILAAAKKVFQIKGLAGARMQEIADEAGINKALLHYYFRSKEKLFSKIFENTMEAFLPVLRDLLEVEGTLEEMIDEFADTYISMLQKNPHIPLFLLNELSQNPARILDMFDSSHIKVNFDKIHEKIDKLVKNGTARNVDARHLIISLLSMCIFPFVAKPLVGFSFDMDDAAFDEFIEERKKIVPELIKNGFFINHGSNKEKKDASDKAEKAKIDDSMISLF